MKNIFKFMGVALMACSLIMVSCKKDDEKSSEPSLTISWDGANQNLGYNRSITAPVNEAVDVYLLSAAKGLDEEGYIEFPEFDVYFVAGAPEGSTEKAIYLSAQAGLQSNFTTTVYIDHPYQTQSGGYTGDWQLYALNSEPTYSDFDATAHSFSCNASMKFYSQDDINAAWEAASHGDEEWQPTDEEWDEMMNNAAKKDMTLNMTNWVFTVAQQ